MTALPEVGRAPERPRSSGSSTGDSERRPRVVATICMRGGSKGVPRKNLRPLDGRPLLVHSIEQALRCPVFERVIASTDDAEMAEVARRAGAEVPGLRPAELASDSASKWHVFRYLCDQLRRGGDAPDVLADLDTGAVLRSDADIAGCVAGVLQTGAEVCVTAYEASHNPYYNLVELDATGLARVSKAHSPPIVNRQAAPPAYCLSPATFAIRASALWKREHWSQCAMRLQVVPRERALDIDTPLDFELVELLFQRRRSLTAAG